MPSTPDRLRHGLLTVATVATATALGACSTSGGTPAPESSTRTTTAGAAPSASPGAAVNALQKLVIDDVPTDFTRAAEKASHTGPTDLQHAIELDGHPDAKAALTTEGFSSGYQRLWTNGTGELIAVQIYRFATVAGARADYARGDRLADSQASDVRRYAVDGHPTDQLRGAEVDVEGNLTDQVIGVSGRDVIQVLCTSTTKSDLRGRASALAERQFDRVAGQGG